MDPDPEVASGDDRRACVGFASATGRSIRAPRRRLPQLAIPAVLASLNPAVTVGLAVVLLPERLARVQTVGIACTILGVVAVAA